MKTVSKFFCLLLISPLALIGLIMWSILLWNEYDLTADGFKLVFGKP